MNLVYINLDHRTDRNEQFVKQFQDVSGDIQIHRFNAIKMSPGYLGCSMSHIKCLEEAKANKWDYIILCEDDFELLVSPNDFVKYIQDAIKQDWDVLVLGGFLKKGAFQNENNMARVTNIQTTVGYIVKSHYYDTLLHNFKEGYTLLASNYDKYSIYGLDQHWKLLQNKDKWYVHVPLLGKQCVGFSDIECTVRNYDFYYLDSIHNRNLIK